MDCLRTYHQVSYDCVRMLWERPAPSPTRSAWRATLGHSTYKSNVDDVVVKYIGSARGEEFAVPRRPWAPTVPPEKRVPGAVSFSRKFWTHILEGRQRREFRPGFQLVSRERERCRCWGVKSWGKPLSLQHRWDDRRKFYNGTGMVSAARKSGTRRLTWWSWSSCSPRRWRARWRRQKGRPIEDMVYDFEKE